VSSAADLRIRLFGEVSIEQDGQPVAIPPTKSLELLCYVLLSTESVVTRETLSNVLWPDAPAAASKRYLRQALWRLNSIFHHDGRNGHPLLGLDSGLVRVKSEASLWLDISAFESAHASLHDIPGDHLDDQQADALRVAVELYRGDLMPTWYQDWCIYERERLQLIRIMMLEKLMFYCESRQRYARAIAYGQAILRQDRARERTHRELMRLYCLTGERTAAVRQYERCARALADEFDLRPDRQTVALHEQIRAEHADALGPGSETSVAGLERPHADLLVDLRSQLESIQNCLRTIEELVRVEPSMSNGHHRPLSAPEYGRDQGR